MENCIKLRINAGDKTPTPIKDKAIADAYRNKFIIPLDFEMLDSAAPYYSGELRLGSRPKSRFCHIFISLSHLNQPTAVKFCTGVELSRVSRMTV